MAKNKFENNGIEISPYSFLALKLFWGKQVKKYRE